MNISFKPKSSTPGKATTTCAILASLFSAALVSASAQTIYSTGFEAPAFQAGFPLPGQDGWIAPADLQSPLVSDSHVLVALCILQVLLAISFSLSLMTTHAH